jgi:predicted RNA binding protein YcfA (HicA-like mRNA interferase family)
MSKLPLCSSDQIVSALKRAGFQPASSHPGSHLIMQRWTGKRTITTIVVLGKKEVPRYTLKNILKQAELSGPAFLKHLR